MSRSEDLMLLITCGLALGACQPTVEPGDDVGPSDGGGGDDRDAVEDAIEICAPWASKTVECFEDALEGDQDDYGYSVSYVSMMGYCIAQVGYAQHMGDDCVAAYDDYFVCLAKVDCAEIFGDVSVEDSDDDAGGGSDEEPDEYDYPCGEHEAALEAACDGPSVGSSDDQE